MRGGGVDNVVEIQCTVIQSRSQSIIISEEETGNECAISRSLISDWWFQETSDQDELDIDYLEKGDEIVLCIPYWLARKENLV
jgi:hypothetical protein